jgi:hypothetical protein
VARLRLLGYGLPVARLVGRDRGGQGHLGRAAGRGECRELGYRARADAAEVEGSGRVESSQSREKGRRGPAQTCSYWKEKEANCE